MNETQIEKYQKLIDKANMKLDNLTFEEKEIMYGMFNETENRIDKFEQESAKLNKKYYHLQKEFKLLAKEVENAILELEIEQFLNTGEIGNAQDVEYN